jgi:hypothetical protein
MQAWFNFFFTEDILFFGSAIVFLVIEVYDVLIHCLVGCFVSSALMVWLFLIVVLFFVAFDMSIQLAAPS